MAVGTVNISRSIWDDVAFKDQPFTEREAFMWLIMEASYLPREKRVGNVVVSLERGQAGSSIRFMAEAWKWPKSTVSRFLKRLEKRDMIGTASGTAVSIITICKYDEYQTEIKESGTPKKRKAGQQRDSSGTNYNKGSTKDNNDNTPLYPPKWSDEKISFAQIMEPTIGHDLAIEVVNYRYGFKSKAPLTKRVFEGLDKQFKKFPDPAGAVNEMISRGWKSVDPDWVESSNRTANSASRNDQPSLATEIYLKNRGMLA